MADIEITFEGDDGPLRGVIGRLSKEIINFAKRSEAAFGSIQTGIEGVGRAGSASERTLEKQRRQLEALQKASRFDTRSEFGFDVSQIREIQKALQSSTSEAESLKAEFSQQNSFLREQVAQYQRVLNFQRQVNDLVGQQGGMRQIEAQAGPQLTSAPTNQLGFTDAQVAAIQAALAQSVTSARELTEEFIRQNAAVSESREIVARQGSAIEKYGESSKKSFSDARNGALLLASEFGVVEGEIIDSSGAIEKFSDGIIDAEIVGEDLGETISRSGDQARSSWTNIFNNIGTQDLPALRYALYDIGNNLTRIGLALTTLGVAPLAIAANYEREFANVIRTNELAKDDVADLRNEIRRDLERIAQSTPIPWEDITNIATLAGQLGIAQQSVGQFTETVAKFSATTDLTVDAAATAFGRLDQLISGIDGNFENLGSAILAVGVDSVATESQIVNVSTQIASMGNLAGLTAPEIIGLSGALASLGIRPELARGNITRLFSRIGASAVEGGAKVDEFGRLTGRTADQFVEDWGTDPGAVLQDFFEGINREGPEAERTLRSLGITSVRDIPAILRLAQSSDEVRRLIALSSAEYIRGNEVTEQYGIIAGTVSANVTRLVQNFELLQSSIGQSVNLLSGLIGVLNLVVQGFNLLVDNPFGATISAIVIAVAALAGGFALLVAQAAFVAAAVLAVTFVLRKLGIDLNRSQISQLLFKGSLDQTIVSLYNQAVASGASSVALEKLAISLNKASIGAKIFRGVLRSLLITTGIGIAFVALTAAIGFFVEKSEQADEQAEQLYGSLEGLEEALIRDGQAFDQTTGKMEDGSKAFAVYSKSLDNTTEALADNIEVAQKVADGQDAIADATENANKALEEQETILASGENVLQFFGDQALLNEEIVNLFADPTFLKAMEDAGLTVRQLFEQGLEGIDVGPALEPIRQQIQAEIDALETERYNIDFGIEGDGTLSYRAEDADEQIAELDQQIAELQEKLLGVDTFETFVDGMDETVEGAAEASDGVDNFSTSLDISTEKVSLLRDEMEELNRILFSEARYIADVEDSVNDLANAFGSGAEDAQLASGAIGDAVESILNEPSGNVDVILGNLAGLLALLQAQGPSTAAAQEFVRSAIEEVGNQAGMETGKVLGYAQALNATANFDAANFQELIQNAMAEVGNAASGAAGEVKSLADEMDELLDSIFDPINAAQDQAEAIFDLGEAYAEVGKSALYGSDEMEDAIRSITDAAESPEQAIGNLQVLFQYLARTVGSETDPSLQVLRRTIELMSKQFGIAAEQATQFANINLDNFKKGVESVQEEVRTLLDYGGDLDKVVSRAFDIRYADLLQVDRIAGSWEDIADEIEKANESLEELYATQKDLAADRAIKEYFLSIAEAYGDDLRADTLRNEIEEINKQQEEAANELRQQELIAGTEILGDNEVARQNRGALLDLVREYQDYIVILAESGASQDELRRESQRLKAEFIEQATELGFAEEKVLEYAEAFDDLTFAIDNVPRDVTIEADVNPALTALRELQAQQQRNIDKANELNNALGQAPSSRPSGSGGETETQKDRLESSLEDIDAQLDSLRNRINALQGSYNSAPSYAKASIAQSLRSAQSQYQSYVTAKRETLRALSQLYTGGFTGRGGKYDPAGIVHRGEYVVPKNMVDQSRGLPNAQFLAQMQAMQGYQMGGFVGGGAGASFPDAMMVELSPYDRQLLENAGNVQLRLDGRVIAQATNRNNVSAAQRGSN